MTTSFDPVLDGGPERLLDPYGRLDFPANWTRYLALHPGDSIAAVEMDVPPEVTVDDVMLVNPITTAWLRWTDPEAAVDQRSRVFFVITTSIGLVDRRSFTLVGTER